MRFDSRGPSERFRRLQVDASSAEVAEDALSQSDTGSLSWFIHMYDLLYGSSDQIGVGAFGEVFKATWRNTPVVVKFMGYADDEDAYNHELFFHELRVWIPLNHPHVLKLYGACHVGKRYFVCESAGGGTLVDYLKKHRVSEEANSARAWQLLHQVALGLQYLHEHNILHNDLKCDNVLIGANGDAKIIDFGLSSILNSAEIRIDPKKLGAVPWRSPEVLTGDRATLASDVYAFGMVIIEALTGTDPWANSAKVDAVVHYRVKKGMLPLQPACMTGTQWTLIRMMCASEPTHRVAMSFVVEKLSQLAQQ